MKLKEVNPDELAYDRYRLMQKGFLNKKEVMAFVPCGASKANQIIQGIRNEVKLEGLENLDSNTVLVKRIITYLGLTEKKISDAYEKSASRPKQSA